MGSREAKRLLTSTTSLPPCDVVELGGRLRHIVGLLGRLGQGGGRGGAREAPGGVRASPGGSQEGPDGRSWGCLAVSWEV